MIPENMNLRTVIRFACLALIFLPAPFRAAAEDFTNALRAHLQHHLEGQKRPSGILVGLVDEHGTRIVSCGKIPIRNCFFPAQMY